MEQNNPFFKHCLSGMIFYRNLTSFCKRNLVHLSWSSIAIWQFKKKGWSSKFSTCRMVYNINACLCSLCCILHKLPFVSIIVEIFRKFYRCLSWKAVLVLESFTVIENLAIWAKGWPHLGMPLISVSPGFYLLWSTAKFIS